LGSGTIVAVTLGIDAPARTKGWSLSDRLDDARPRRFVILEDDGAFAELVEEWLARHGLAAVPIGEARADGGAVGLAAVPDGAGFDGAVASNGHHPPMLAEASERWIAERLAASPLERTGLVVFGPIEIDTGRLEVRVDGIDIHLTPTEFRLLRHLAEHPERVAGHRELLTAVWGRGYEDDVHLLQVTIRSLRARIALVTGRQIVETVYGAGYRIASLETAPTTRTG
jgi:DNA-binding winged helix-turn-helix (wHTH) protein